MIESEVKITPPIPLRERHINGREIIQAITGGVVVGGGSGAIAGMAMGSPETVVLGCVTAVLGGAAITAHELLSNKG